MSEGVTFLTSSAFRPPGNLVPPPSIDATKIEDALQKNFSDGLPNIDQLSLQLRHPIRPGYGTRGEKVILFANYFELVTEPDLVLYRYSIQTLPQEKGRKLAQIVRLLLELPIYAAIKDHLVTDFKSTLICRKKLSVTEIEHQIQYRTEGEEDARASATTYKVAVQETGILSVPQLVAFLTSTTIDSAFIEKGSTIQALNIFRSYFSKASPGRATIGARKSFDLNKAETKDLGAGLLAIRGFLSSVRVAASRILVNINVTNASFYKVSPLIGLMREFGQAHQQDLRKTEKFLKKLRVKVIHIPEKKNKLGQSTPRIKTIWGLASPDDGLGLSHPPKVQRFGAGANDVKFFLDPSTGPPSSSPSGTQAARTRGKGGGKKKKRNQVSEPSSGPSNSGATSQGRYISVYEYFSTNYPHHPIQNPNVPVVNVGSRENPSYLPVDVCVVEPGQNSTSKLSPQQTKEMIAFAVRKPYVNAQSIVDAGPGTVGMLQQVNPMMTNFGISMSRDLITVPGRVLPPSKVNYKNSSAEVKDGSWNMLKVKFNTAATLKSWTTLIISERNARPDFPDQASLKPTMTNFHQALQKIGVIASPPQEGPPPVIINNPGDLPKIDEILKRISERGFELVFVVLSSDNTPFYDYLKTIADTKYGLHTICSVSSKLVKNQSQYFNNVALKVNLKLGGINQLVDNTRLGVINEGKTMVIGIDVTHPSPGSASNAPSVTSMVASVDRWLGQWPATLLVQTGREEMVKELDNMLKSRLLLWKAKNNNTLPANLLVYRDGVSEGQYDLVLDVELPRLRAACKALYPASDTKNGLPCMTIVICGKRHATRFYSSNVKDTDKSSNPRNGTVVDRGVTEPNLWDFYLQAHTALQGTARSCHYIVILDEILRKRPVKSNMGYKNIADVLEDMTYCMCHLFGRATKTVSLCPPAKYADIVCERARKYLSGYYDPSALSATGSAGVGGRADPENEDIQVHPKLRDTMFYI